MKSLKDCQKKKCFSVPLLSEKRQDDRMSFQEMGSMASSRSTKAEKKAAKVDAVTRPCAALLN